MTGREAEKFVALYLHRQGYFVGDFNKGTSGEQPFDQIAIGKDLIMAYDVKHCDKDYFSFTRIEDNQMSALTFLTNLKNNSLHTAIIFVYDNNIYHLSFSHLKALLHQGRKSIKPSELTALETILRGF